MIVDLLKEVTNAYNLRNNLKYDSHKTKLKLYAMVQ